MKTPYLQKPKPPMDLLRPLSWSAISSFGYSKEQWYSKYIMGEEQPPSDEMLFGKQVDLRIQEDAEYLPEITRYEYLQYELRTTIEGIPLLGYPDALDLGNPRIRDFKTGKKLWSKKRADETGQITMYILMIYLIHNIKPEKFECYIDWMPTHKKDGIVMFKDPFEVKTFKTKRTMVDILKFAQLIKETRQNMIDYYNNHA